MSANAIRPTGLDTGAPGHPLPEDLALYAMQDFNAGEAASIAEHVAKCPQCRQGLSRLYDDIAAYALTAETATPSLSVRERVLAQVAREKKIVFSIGETRPERESRSAIPASGQPASHVPQPIAPAEPEPLPTKGQPARTPVMWFGWAMAALLGILGGFLGYAYFELNQTLQQRTGELARLTKDAASSHQLLDALTDPQAVRITLITPSGVRTGPVAGVTYNADKGTLIMLASNLDPVRRFKAYQLWLIPADRSGPISAGTFHPDDRGGASIILPDIPKGIPAKAFNVTMEDAGGSKKPTLPILLSGPSGS